jgi:putative MFS transporter
MFQTSMIFWGLGSLACGPPSPVTMLGASRLLLGFGMGMEFPVAQSLVSCRRTKCTTTATSFRQ